MLNLIWNFSENFNIVWMPCCSNLKAIQLVYFFFSHSRSILVGFICLIWVKKYIITFLAFKNSCSYKMVQSPHLEYKKSPYVNLEEEVYLFISFSLYSKWPLGRSVNSLLGGSLKAHWGLAKCLFRA